MMVNVVKVKVDVKMDFVAVNMVTVVVPKVIVVKDVNQSMVSANKLRLMKINNYIYIIWFFKKNIILF